MYIDKSDGDKLCYLDLKKGIDSVSLLYRLVW